MAVTHSGSAKAAATDAITALLGANAKLKFRLSGTISSPGTAAATLSLATPSAFGAANGTTGIATAGAITSDTSATGNASPVATASLETSGGTIIIHCAVAASASDINMSGGLTIGAGDTVSCSSLTYQAIPS